MFPQVPLQVMVQDLLATNNINRTIDNIVSGRLDVAIATAAANEPSTSNVTSQTATRTEVKNASHSSNAVMERKQETKFGEEQSEQSSTATTNSATKDRRGTDTQDGDSKKSADERRFDQMHDSMLDSFDEEQPDLPLSSLTAGRTDSDTTDSKSAASPPSPKERKPLPAPREKREAQLQALERRLARQRARAEQNGDTTGSYGG